MSNLVVVQLIDDSQHVQLTDDIQHVQLTNGIQHVQLTNGMIQRSFDRYEIESDEEELDLQVDYTADISNQRSLDESKLSLQRFDKYEIESDEEELDLQVDYTAGNMNQRSDEIDEEEYWYSVEQERMKEEYWHLVEQLQEEHSIPTEDHLLILNTTLSIILEIEQELDLQVDHESFKKMICNIYPEVCQLYCTLDSLYQL